MNKKTELVFENKCKIQFEVIVDNGFNLLPLRKALCGTY